MDKPDNVISLINLATVRSLEEQWGYNIDPLRFRANFYIDVAIPVGGVRVCLRDIRIVDGLFRVYLRNGRCVATNFNPETVLLDLDLPASLRAAFWHNELCIYLVARENAQVAVVDTVSAPMTSGGISSSLPLSLHLPAFLHLFICFVFYFIFYSLSLLSFLSIPALTSFNSIPSNCFSRFAAPIDTFLPHF